MSAKIKILKRILIGVFSAAFVAIVTFAVGIVFFDWFSSEEEIPYTGVSYEADSSNNLVLGSSLSSGVKLAAEELSVASDEYETAYSLTATLDNTDLTDKSITWSVEWVDSSITDDISDYITLSSNQSESGVAVTLYCYGGFNNQIKIVATANGASGSGSVEVDYVKRITGFTVGDYMSSLSSYTWDTTTSVAADSEITYQYGNGTLTDDVDSSSVVYTVTFSDSLKSTLESAFGVSDWSYTCSSTSDLNFYDLFADIYGVSSTIYTYSTYYTFDVYDILSSYSSSDIFKITATFTGSNYSKTSTLSSDVLVDSSAYNLSGVLSYLYDGTYYTVKGIGKYTSTSLTIPSTYNSKTVYYIDSSAFSGNTSIKSINTGTGVRSIGSSAFSGCTAVTSLTVGTNVTTLGSQCFYNMTKLSTLTYNAKTVTDLSSTSYVFYKAGQSGSGITMTVGSSVTKIPAYLFYNGSADYYSNVVSVSYSGTNCTSIGNSAFRYTKLTSITIPDSVTSLGTYVYASCSNATSLSIGSGVTRLSDGAFYSCTGLTDITIPDIVVSLGSSTFARCYGLISISIPDSVKSLGSYAFQYCTSASSLTIGSGIGTIGSHSFDNCTSLTSVIIPDNVTTLDTYCFNGCSSVTSLTIGSGVTTIGTGSFYNLTNLSTLIYNATTVTDLTSTSYVFYCAGQSGSGITMTVGSSVTKIPAYLFYNGSSYYVNITSVSYSGTNCTSIGNSAFRYTKLSSITIPDSVTSLGTHAYARCSNVTSLSIGDGLTSISGYCFSYCTSLSSVSYGSALINIDSYAFYDCTSLTSLVIPDSVTTVGTAVFYNCSGATSIYMGSGLSSYSTDFASSYFFLGCTSVDTITYNCVNFSSTLSTRIYFFIDGFFSDSVSFILGDDVEYVPAYLCYGLTCLTDITIGASVVSMADYCFYGCTNVSKIYYDSLAMEDLTGQRVYIFYNVGSDVDGGCSLYLGKNVKVDTFYVPSYMFANSYLYLGKVYTSPSCGGVAFGYRSFYFNRISGLYCYGSSIYLGQNSFESCRALTGVYFDYTGSSWPVYIDDYAFYRCDVLESINLGDFTAYIGFGAFYGCSALTSVSVTEDSGTWSVGWADDPFLIPEYTLLYDSSFFAELLVSSEVDCFTNTDKMYNKYIYYIKDYIRDDLNIYLSL